MLSDGSNGIAVDRRTRIRDQEHAPVAADIKRVMLEKARIGEKIFALTEDVAEAHRQIQVEAGGDVYINKVGTFGVAFLLLVTRGHGSWNNITVHPWKARHVAPVGR